MTVPTPAISATARIRLTDIEEPTRTGRTDGRAATSVIHCRWGVAYFARDQHIIINIHHSQRDSGGAGGYPFAQLELHLISYPSFR